MKSKIKDFMNKAEAEKQQIMENLNSEISALQQKIKDDIAQKKEDFENELKNLIEKGTEVAKYLSYKVCDIAQMDYEDCRNNKKQLLLNLLNAVKENFGQCSVVIQQITKLTESAELNLKYILFLINAITENPDAIEKGKTQVVYDILNCLEEKLEEYWPIVGIKILLLFAIKYSNSSSPSKSFFIKFSSDKYDICLMNCLACSKSSSSHN
jgi:hypothetical protein